MIGLEQIKELAISSPSKIVMLIIDGIGGLPDRETGKTELETAQTPNLDRLAEQGVCGLIDPVSPGITPGSAPGHFALFGYDPFRFSIGRGVLEALGIGFDVKDGDVAARGNFCTVDNTGLISDRRAGRISSEKCAELCELLSFVRLDDVQLWVLPVREHRFLAVFGGEELHPEVTDSDPQRIGSAPNVIGATSPEGRKMARLANQFIYGAREILSRHYPANMVLLRGFSQLPSLPKFSEIFKLNPAAIAAYPMYKGLAKLVGMKIIETGSSPGEEFVTLAHRYDEHDFFYIHIKQTDSAGEDGDFYRKVKAIEDVDNALPSLLGLKPDVIIVTGDHSTPALLEGHSWHPVPFLLYSQRCRRDKVGEFSESACVSGGLGRFPAVDIMPLAMANALKLSKFGA
ncbi:MAG: 2,3-bisphosphoglycerate-independent phosphoglycerate mutase [Dehalococcoidia bacterium]|nr:MAG: 2,3-bisphosphoglycerate-independent phosphoglycerate mutase [Dehalococcoidia bacterium]